MRSPAGHVSSGCTVGTNCSERVVAVVLRAPFVRTQERELHRMNAALEVLFDAVEKEEVLVVALGVLGRVVTARHVDAVRHLFFGAAALALDVAVLLHGCVERRLSTEAAFTAVAALASVAARASLGATTPRPTVTAGAAASRGALFGATGERGEHRDQASKRDFHEARFSTAHAIARGAHESSIARSFSRSGCDMGATLAHGARKECCVDKAKPPAQ